jgi:hypothetical protein
MTQKKLFKGKVEVIVGIVSIMFRCEIFVFKKWDRKIVCPIVFSRAF